ncbi:MAG: hypothetical protein N4A35_15495 [Flavobacteriales bacterium]|nr:hypothetical protein [Flavobacteriales bacterium]
MKLVADSGSTKTDWRVIEAGEVVSEFETEGINPYFKSSEEIIKLLKYQVVTQLADETEILAVYFYGAGCSSESKNQQLAEDFKKVFINADVNIKHDLLGAAIASCGNEKGIVAILGTGSNSCLFDGQKILKEQNSLGYILGDEGAGSNIGKRLLIDFLYGRTPDHITIKMKEELNLSKNVILDHVYKQALPNRYLASFVEWISLYIKEDEYLQRVVLRAFDEFFITHLIRYEDYKNIDLNIVGSIGYHFKEYLYIVAFKHDMKLGKVIKKPIDGLVEYHSK